MTLAKLLHAMGKEYGKAPHELMGANPAELSFDFEVMSLATAE